MVAGIASAVDVEHFYAVSIDRLELRCINADPNYGVMWFQCRQRPSDTARAVLRRAKVTLANELSAHAPVYALAMRRRFRVEHRLRLARPAEAPPESGVFETEAQAAAWEEVVVAALRAEPPVETAAAGAAYRSEDFVTGLVSLNRTTALMSQLGDEERRRVLFGSDQIVP